MTSESGEAPTTDGDETVPPRVSLTRSPRSEVIDFLVTECALADEHRYLEWESLWAEAEGLYWVCGPGDTTDPASGFSQASFIYDNRGRIASRVRQLATNKRLSQVPTSELSRVMSNYRLAPDPDAEVTACWVNFIVTEFRAGRMRTWAGRTLYRVRQSGPELRMIEKRVVLVDRAAPLDTFTFIL